MRFQTLLCPAALLLTSVVLFNCPKMLGQVLQPKTLPLASQQEQSPDPSKAIPTESLEANQPYKLTSRFHLQKGAGKGYLIVKVELPKGSYIYSMAQKAPLRPSKIAVTKSSQFRLSGKFNPDRPATVIKDDPIFHQRLEKHTDVIQFFAPVEISPGVKPDTLAAEMTFTGQVCNDEGYCLPIKAVKTKARFAGFFERSAEKQTPGGKMPIDNPPR